MKVRIKKLDERATVPTYGTEYSAGADLYNLAGETVTIPAHSTLLIHTGISAEIPEGYCGLIFARSGLASKRGLAPANKVGVIDADYRGEVMVSVSNTGEEDYIMQPDERFAQMVFVPVYTAAMTVVDDLDETERGAGGFGSTGV